MRKQNFKSDFDFILSLIDTEGNDAGFPADINWELVLLTTSRQLTYTASYQYGEYRNCRNEDGKIHIYVDRHEFPVGELLYELTAEIPDKGFSDGSRKVAVSGSTDIEIVSDRGQSIVGAVVPVPVPHLKKEEQESPDNSPTTPEVTE